MRHRLLLIIALGLGCGPAIQLDGGAAGSEGSESSDGPITTTSTSTSTTSPTTTTSTSTSTTTVGTVTVATTSDPDGSTSDTGMVFIPDPDTGIGCGSCCDIWAQDCPEGEKCSAWSNDGLGDWNAPRCSPIDANPGQPGDPCTVEGSVASGIDSCDLDTMCWNVDPGTLQGTCVALCSGDDANPICESPDDGCLIANDGVLNLCLPMCDPVMGDCPPGQACLPAGDSDFVCVTTVAGEDAVAGDPCDYVYDCEPGLVCLSVPDVSASCDVGASGCCTPYCDLAAGDPTAGCFDPAQVCAAWFPGGAPPGLEDVGACVLP